MKYGYIKTAAATPLVTVADCAANEREILYQIHVMEKKHVKLMVFPELCLTGYTCQDLFFQRKLIDDAWKALLDLAKKTTGVDALILVGLPLRVAGKLYNVAAALNQGRILGFIPKSHIPNHQEFYEKRWFASGVDLNTYVMVEGEEVPVSAELIFRCEEMKDFAVGVEICEDLWVPSPPSVYLASSGASIIANLSASNETTGKEEYRRSLVKGQSARLVCGYIYANAGEGESTTDLVFGGQNMICENGVLLAEGERFSNDIVVSEIDVGCLNDERQKLTTFPAQEGLCQEVPFSVKLEKTVLTRKIPASPFIPSKKEEMEKRCEEILQIQAMGLKKRMQVTKAERMIVGLSGGLDSTLALLVMARTADLQALERDRILAVTMPCFGTTDRTYENACALASRIGAELREIDIKEAVQTHFRDIGHAGDSYDAAYENSQARERTQVLMDLANQENGLVVGTGDLSELALGWATYNGDHMAMYGVNASVPKTLVRYLVRYYADYCGSKELSGILYDILDTPVSPELLPPKDGEIAQKTEDLVGPYELHDFFLFYLFRYGFSPKKIFRLACCAFEGSYSPSVIAGWLKIFIRRFFSQQYKRSCMPDGPKVGSVSLSPRGDLRMPSDASSASWLAEAALILEKLS
ncbi:MAG: NAD(+) synthase [Blautia sp.]|nr:NAD(+) synthase [Blautia sp.]